MKFTDTSGAAVSFRFRFSVLSVLFLRVFYETLTVPDGIQTPRVVAWFVRVQQIPEIAKQYEERLRGMLFVPTFSYGRRMLREDDAPNAIRLGFEQFPPAIVPEIHPNLRRQVRHR